MAMDIRNWCNNFHDPLSTQIAEMKTIWDEIGRSPEFQQDEIYEMLTSIEHLSSRILERKFQQLHEDRQKLLVEAESLAKRVIQLTRTLDLPTVEPDENMSLLQVIDFLNSRVVDLEQVQRERQALLDELLEQEEKLAEQLGELCIKITETLTQKTLDSVRHRLTCLQEEKKCRFEIFLSKKEKIVQLMNELENIPDTKFEHDIVFQNETDFKLTKINLDAMASLLEKYETDVQSNEAEGKRLRENLRVLWNALQLPGDFQQDFLTIHVGNKPSTLQALKQEVDRCRQLKMENARQYIHNVRQQISNMWDRCFVCLQYRRNFRPVYEDDITEEVIDAHDCELERLTNLYYSGRELFDKFEKHASLWERMLKLEKPDNDTCRFKNRGGRLLKEEKEKKKLMIMIPKLEIELEALMAKRESENAPALLIYGKNVMDFIKDQWDVYEQEKENEKQKRHDKAKLMENEVVNGTKVNTTKRRLVTTPGKEPQNKCRKLTPLSSNVMSGKSSAHSVFGRPGAMVTNATKTRIPPPRRLLGQRTRMNEAKAPPEVFVMNDSVVAQQPPMNLCSSTMNLTTSSHFANFLQGSEAGVVLQPFHSSPMGSPESQ